MTDINDDTELAAKLSRARSRYAKEWGGGNATKFSVEGYYAWMAGFLEGHNTVLEVGVGNGSSTLALLSAGHTVIGVDENPACLRAAGETLAASGGSVTSEFRGDLSAAASGYSVSYSSPQSLFPESGCLLLEGDIMDDHSLLEWIQDGKSVDAIVCWLMGTYQERTLNSSVAGAGIKNPAGYRATVQQQVCRIADRLLPEQGVVHIVDRCLMTPDEFGDVPGSGAWLERCGQAYRSRAEGTSLDVATVNFLDYFEPESDAGPSVKLTRSLSGHNPDASDKAFVSIVLKRPK